MDDLQISKLASQNLLLVVSKLAIRKVLHVLRQTVANLHLDTGFQPNASVNMFDVTHIY